GGGGEGGEEGVGGGRLKGRPGAGRRGEVIHSVIVIESYGSDQLHRGADAHVRFQVGAELGYGVVVFVPAVDGSSSLGHHPLHFSAKAQVRAVADGDSVV